MMPVSPLRLPTPAPSSPCMSPTGVCMFTFQVATCLAKDAGSLMSKDQTWDLYGPLLWTKVGRSTQSEPAKVTEQAWGTSGKQFLAPCRSLGKSCPTLCDPIAAAHHTSLSFAISWSLLKVMSIESVMPSNHLILCPHLLLLPSVLSQHQGLFQWVSSSHQVSKVLELKLQHQSF